MAVPAPGYRRTILLPAIREFVETARRKRAALPEAASDRRFYLGVEAAAQQVLHPEIGASRDTDWLDHEAVEFREGYLRAEAVLANALTAAEPPLRVLVPEPDPNL